MADADVSVGIDGSPAKAGSDFVVKQLERIGNAADAMSSRAGKRIDNLYSKIQKLAGVTAPSTQTISRINSLSAAVTSLGVAKGPSASMVRNVSAFFRAVGAAKIPTNLSGITGLSRALDGFRGPSAKSVANLASLFRLLSSLPNTAGLSRLISNLRFTVAALAPLGPALTRLQGAGGAAANGLKRAGTAARSASADMIGMRASSLSLGGALLRTGEFAAALGSAFGLASIAKEIGVFEKTSATLMAVTGSMAQARKEMEFLSQTARTYKIYVGDLSQGYAQFRAASVGLGLTVSETQGIFTGVTQAVRVFNLSTDDAEGVFRALTQIASKSSLQMEELRGQLGDRMPVAVQAFANGLGVSTQALTEMMKKGQVTGAVLKAGMIGFSEELKRMTDPGLAAATSTLGASLGDLKTTFYEFANALGQAGLTDFFQNVAAGLQDVMRSGSAANGILLGVGGALALVSRNVEILGVALALLALPKFVAMIGSVSASVLALSTTLAANSAVTGANAASQVGLIGRLAILGEMRSMTVSATNLATASTAGNTAAVYANVRANGTLITSLAVVRGALRALWLVILANPLTSLIVVLGALAAAFFVLKDRMDLAKQASDAYATAADNAGDSSLATMSSIQALSTEYMNLANSANTAALAMARTDALKARKQSTDNTDTAITGLRRLQSRNEGRLVQVGSAPGGAGLTDEAIASGLRDVSQQLGASRLSGSNLSRSSRRERDALEQQDQFLRTIQSERRTTAQQNLRVVSSDQAEKLRASGVTGAEFSRQLAVRQAAAAKSLGLDIPAMEQVTAAPDAATEKAGKSGSSRMSDAERAAKQLKQEIEGLLSRLDRVYDSNLRVAESMETIKKISEEAFGSQTVERLEIMRRAINDAFPNMAQFDTIGNMAAEWGDTGREVEAYVNAMREAGLAVGGLENRLMTLTGLQFMSGFSDSLGPVAEMSGLILDQVRMTEELASNTERFGFSQEMQVDLARRLGQEFSNNARELATSNQAGQILNAQYAATIDTVTEIRDLISDTFGPDAAAGITESLRAANREATKILPGALDGLKKASPAAVSAGEDIGDQITQGTITAIDANAPRVEDVVVTGVRVTAMKSAAISEEIGRQAGDQSGLAFAQAQVDAIERSRDRMINSMKAIFDVMGAGAVGEIRATADAIALATVNTQKYAATTGASAQQVATMEAGIKRLNFAAQQQVAAYYSAQLSASKFGSVASNAIDSASDAVSEFAKTGILDISTFFQEVQADMLKTFVLTPVVNAMKKAVATRMGVADPTDQAGGANALQAASTAMVGSAQTVSNLMREAATLQAQTDVMAQTMITSINGAVVALDSAALRLAAVPGGTPGVGGVTAGNVATVPGGIGTVPTPATAASAITNPGSMLNPAGTANPLERPAQQLGTVATGLSAAVQGFASGNTTWQAAGTSFIASVIPGMISNIVSMFATSTAQTGAAVATGTSAVTLGTAAVALTGAAAALTSAAIAMNIKSMIPLPMHSGGLVKATGPMSGVKAGLKSDEVMKTLQAGEEVLTASDPRHSSNLSATAGKMNGGIVSGPSHVQDYYAERGSEPMSSGGSVTQQNISTVNVTVHTQGGGTPAQNADMADQLGKTVDRILKQNAAKTQSQKSRNPGMGVR